MIPDSIEVDEFKTGLRREGLYTGTNMLVRKIGTALALWAVGIFLSAIGYVPDQVQSESTLTGIRMLYAYGTALCLVASVFFVFFLPMTEAKHALLKKAIRSKKDGQPVDDSGIKDLL
jgi:Na+/melibiose symporter-like transporter